MITLTSLLMLTGLCAANESHSATTPVLENAMPVRRCGPWEIEVGPGSIMQAGKEIRLPQPLRFDIAPTALVAVRDERQTQLPVFNPDSSYRKGKPLAALQTEECSATGCLAPDSLRLKLHAGDTPLLTRGVDYDFDPFWGTLGRLEHGAIAADQEVFVDYDYAPCRLDSIVADSAGKVHLVQGTPGVGAIRPPEPGSGECALVYIWVPGRLEALTDDSLYPIEFRDPPKSSDEQSVAERLLPKTLAMLRAAEPVTIVAWGDSVTNGGGVDGHVEQWYQNQFLAGLKQRFPTAPIRLLTAAWPGAGSKQYLEAPKGGAYDFERDVLAPKPDLVTIEFVNDAYLDEAGTMAHYSRILKQLRTVGAEVALITPHLIRPDWMQVTSMKLDEDPRPYVRALRRFARENDVALADASAVWCRLWRQGTPHCTLQANSINHPDERGHAIFAKSLLDLFPER